MAISLGTVDGDWQSGGGTIATLSGTTQQGAPVQQTGTVQVTDPIQTTANPQSQYSVAPTGSTTSTAPAYDPVAAARAVEEQQRNTVRSSISSLIDQALGVYDTLYGNVRGSAASQKGALESRYDRETGALTDQFNVEMPKIGRSFAGRGAYDSSYRIEGEQQAGNEFANQIRGLGEEVSAEKAKIAQGLTGQEAELGTGKSLLELTKSRLGEVSDLGELQALQSEIQRKIVELGAQAQATTPQAAQLADRLPQLQTTLTNVINGQAPAALKRAVAQQIIGSAGLPKDQEDQLLAQVNTQIVG